MRKFNFIDEYNSPFILEIIHKKMEDFELSTIAESVEFEFGCMEVPTL